MVALILCDRHDPSAPWLADGLRRAGHDVALVTADELACALRLVHRLSDGGTHVDVRLPGGRDWNERRVDGVVNRLRDIPRPRTPGVPGPDLDYAQDELRAITVSWLAGLADAGVPFVGRPTPAGLSGAWRSPSEWALLASASGLPARPVQIGAALPPSAWGDQAIVVGSQAMRAGSAEPLDDRRAEGLRRLARLADADTLAAVFDRSGALVFAEHLPDLRLAGTAAITIIGSMIDPAGQTTRGVA